MINTNVALVIKTGEVVAINYSTHQIQYDIDLNEKTGKINIVESHRGESEYLLSNGSSYSENEIIVGIDNIREWKIKQIENGEASELDG